MNLKSLLLNPRFINYFLIFFVPYLLIVISGGSFIYISDKEQEIKELKQVETLNTRQIYNAINLEFNEIFKDITFLANAVNLRELIAEPNQKKIAHLTDDFINFSSSKTVYDQIRLIDKTGQEIIRVDYHPEKPQQISETRLQNKKERYYFKDSFKLKKGEIYVSPLDLNIEHGAIEVPYKPMIRIATPVVNSDGEKFGVIILNYYGKNLLEKVKNTLKSASKRIYLLNKDGFWLASPNPDDEWGFMLGKDTRINLRYPSIWHDMLAHDQKQLFDDSGLWTYDTIYPLIRGTISSTGAKLAFEDSETMVEHQDFFWKIASHLPIKEFNQIVEKSFSIIVSIVIVLVLFGLLSSVYIALLALRHEQADIRSQKLSEREQLLQNMAEGVFGIDKQGKCTFINKQALSLLGYTKQELLGKKIHDLIHHHYQDGRKLPYNECFSAKVLLPGSVYSAEDWLYHKNGTGFPVSINATPIVENEQVLGTVISFLDISKQKESEELLWYQKNYDHLTSLPKRKFFQNLLSEHLKKIEQKKHQLWLLILDIDDFKEINELHGHDIGDQLLLLISERLQSLLGENDLLGRLAGDEFIIMLANDLNVEEVDKVSSKLQKKLNKSYLLNDTEISITTSMGIANFPNDANNATDLLKFSEQSMSVAKKEGKNQFTYFTPEFQYASLLRTQVIDDIKKAILNNEFQLYYQPIVNLKTGEVYKAEALIRWIHPEKGIIGPNGFIPIAEETGFICELGTMIFDKAFEQLKKWHTLFGSEFQLSINMSPLQLTHKNPQYHQWIEALKTPPPYGKNIVIEITEGLLIKDEPTVNKKLLEYRDAGIQVAIDDFGTGYSSLSYLKEFDIDYLKIDQSFVRNLKPGSVEESLSEAIIVMAHKLGMQVIAEGIETEQHRDLLIEMGCDYGQGYLFSKPVPSHIFEEKYQKSTINHLL